MERETSGFKRDPKKPKLFSLTVRKGKEVLSDSEDSDFSPERSHYVEDSEGSTDSEEEGYWKKTKKPSSKRAGRTSQKQTKRPQKQKNGSTRAKRLKRSDQKAVAVSTSSRHTTGAAESADKSSLPSTKPVPILPPEVWLHIFRLHVIAHGALPFLSIASRVCQSWMDLAVVPTLWEKVDLSSVWISNKDQKLKWLARNRLSQCREINLSGWKSLTNETVKMLPTHCPMLETINLSNCENVTAVGIGHVVNCPRLRDINLSYVSRDATSPQCLRQLTEKTGAALRSLVVAGNPLRGFHSVLNSIMSYCPNIDTLDLSYCMFCTGYCVLDVEKFQTSCPKLRVLGLRGCRVLGKDVTRQVQEQAPGFLKLQHLICAMRGAYNDGIADDLFTRLLHNTEDLREVDVRGCRRLDPSILLTSPSMKLEKLYVSRSNIFNYGHILPDLFRKWRHSLKVVDLGWTKTSHLNEAIQTLTDLPTCPLSQLILAGSNVTLPSIRLVLDKLQHLHFLDLTSCKRLPHGIKRQYEGSTALNKLRSHLHRLEGEMGNQSDSTTDCSVSDSDSDS